MKEYWGLKNLREVYCPSCSNNLKVVLNGFFHGELFYCPKEKKVFCVRLVDITKNAGKEYLNQCEEDEIIDTLRAKITRDNYKDYLK